jgi:glycosyltransferase involved in cell wall biosynthesis
MVGPFSQARIPPKRLHGVCLLVTDFDAPTGGVQKNSRLLLKELHRRGIRTFACVRNYHGLAKRECIDGTVVRRFPVMGQNLLINGILYFLGTLFWLLRHRREYDVVHCQQMFGPTMVASVASLITRKPVLTRVTLSGRNGELQDLKRLPLLGIRRRLFKRVGLWVALTREMERELIDFGIARDRITVIYNASTALPRPHDNAATRAALRKELGLTSGKVGVFLGRLAAEKNLDVLIDAWGRIVEVDPDAQLLILGEGGAYRNVEASLVERVRQRGLEGVIHFLGHVSNPQDYLMAADVFILPSAAEGMSNALVEAFACGAPIVATDIPANAEICVDGKNALLVPVADAAALEAAILKIFHSPELARRLGNAAKRTASTDLSVERMIDAYVAAYERLIGAQPA